MGGSCGAPPPRTPSSFYRAHARAREAWESLRRQHVALESSSTQATRSDNDLTRRRDTTIHRASDTTPDLACRCTNATRSPPTTLTVMKPVPTPVVTMMVMGPSRWWAGERVPRLSRARARTREGNEKGRARRVPHPPRDVPGDGAWSRHRVGRPATFLPRTHARARTRGRVPTPSALRSRRGLVAGVLVHRPGPASCRCSLAGFGSVHDELVA
jgi:hypothetical protein